MEPRGTKEIKQLNDRVAWSRCQSPVEGIRNTLLIEVGYQAGDLRVTVPVVCRESALSVPCGNDIARERGLTPASPSGPENENDPHCRRGDKKGAHPRPEPEGTADGPEVDAVEKEQDRGHRRGRGKGRKGKIETPPGQPEGRDDQKGRYEGRQSVHGGNVKGYQPGGSFVGRTGKGFAGHGPFEILEGPTPFGGLTDICAAQAADAEGHGSTHAGRDGDLQRCAAGDVEAHSKTQHGEGAVEAVDDEVAPGDTVGAGDLEKMPRLPEEIHVTKNGSGGTVRTGPDRGPLRPRRRCVWSRPSR